MASTSGRFQEMAENVQELVVLVKMFAIVTDSFTYTLKYMCVFLLLYPAALPL